MASEKFHALKINLAIGFTQKNRLEYIGKAVMMLYLYFVCRTDGQPAVRPGCARCRAPEISHNKGNGGGFTKMLFRRRFTHCAMVIPFILHSFPCSLCIP